MRICGIWDSCIGPFLITVEEGVFYFLNSSLFWLMPFGREIPSMTPFAELMDDFRVSELESVTAQPGLGPPCAEGKSSFCSPGEDLAIPKQSMSSLSLKWQGTDWKNYVPEKGRITHIFASFPISLVLA